MSQFEQSVMSAFKVFLLVEKGIELDFRRYAFLENQYGNTPCYKYSDAEKIVDCMFSFFSKYHVDFKGRFNSSMTIESLRIQTLKTFLDNQLTVEIEEDVFNAVNATKAPEVIIEKAFISTDDDNPCLCIDINEEACDFIRLRLNLKDSKGGCGVDGFINIQYPIYAESQTYLAYGNFEDDIDGLHDDELVMQLVDSIISKASKQVSRRDWELEQATGTSDITKHDNLILHGYYNGLSLALLENNETSEAYVTFECATHEHEEYFPLPFKKFEDIEEAKGYIRSHIANYQTLQDFGISNAIYHELTDSAID